MSKIPMTWICACLKFTLHVTCILSWHVKLDKWKIRSYWGSLEEVYICTNSWGKYHKLPLSSSLLAVPGIKFSSGLSRLQGAAMSRTNTAFRRDKVWNTISRSREKGFHSETVPSQVEEAAWLTFGTVFPFKILTAVWCGSLGRHLMVRLAVYWFTLLGWYAICL